VNSKLFGADPDPTLNRVSLSGSDFKKSLVVIGMFSRANYGLKKYSKLANVVKKLIKRLHRS
jgi:hypothetical protein